MLRPPVSCFTSDRVSDPPARWTILGCIPPSNTHTFSTPQVGLPLTSDGCGATYQLLSAGSTQPVFHLPGSPPRNAKVISSSSTYKVPNDLYSALFKAPKVEEEMVKAAGNVRPLPTNTDLRKAAATFYESSMVTWRLGLHTTLLSKYLHSKFGQEPVMEAVCKKLHGAIQVSRQTSLVVLLWLLRLNTA